MHTLEKVIFTIYVQCFQMRLCSTNPGRDEIVAKEENHLESLSDMYSSHVDILFQTQRLLRALRLQFLLFIRIHSGNYVFFINKNCCRTFMQLLLLSKI